MTNNKYKLLKRTSRPPELITIAETAVGILGDQNYWLGYAHRLRTHLLPDVSCKLHIRMGRKTLAKSSPCNGLSQRGLY